ncbi:MAG TPA: RAMP superfamily CRISPR-associated protein [Thermoanaerobaculia bacterium]|nr:RAMP superfamily CRISPR-associated protein [Thermoanaerobaculia bacterium]
MEIHYTLEFEEPWRVGSGEAAGAWLDGLVRRDGLGLPFVPGSTVRGLAADALGKVLKALGLETCQRSAARPIQDGKEGPPGSLCGVTRAGTCPTCALFGSNYRPGPVLWWPARLVLDDGNGGGKEPSAEQAQVVARTGELLFRGRPRTAIDRRSGRAEDQHLFALEEVLPDWRFQGRVDLGEELTPQGVSLVLAALRFVREVGSSRRRGLGRCRFEIEKADLEPAFADWREAIRGLENLDAFDRRVAGRPAAPPAARSPSLNPELPALLQLEATVLGEVSVGGTPEAGNLVPGLAYVPGSTLRGALAARWRGGYEGETFGRAFLSGAVQFGFLYPRPKEGSALPTPRSMATCKLHPGPEEEDGHRLYDLLPGRESEDCPIEGCGARLVPRVKPFTAGGKPVGIDLALSPHNAIDPGAQTVRPGGLFAYEALPQGRLLMGYLRGESHAALEELLAGLGVELGRPFELRVGRRKGSLGALVCTLSQVHKDGGIGLFPDLEEVPKRAGETGAVRIDLLTPAIVLDPWLRFKTFLTPQDFGLEREGFSASFCDGEVLTGWNSAHRLPKSDQVAVAAGSTFRLDGATEAELATLKEWAEKGIGLRREEGFGQFAVRLVTKEEHT